MFNFTSLCVEPALLAKCSTLTKNPKIAAVNLSLVSRICHKIINSKEFFEAIIMPLGLKFKLDLKNNFKENYFSFRKIYLVDTQLLENNKNSVFLSCINGKDKFHQSINIPSHFRNVDLSVELVAKCNRYLATSKNGTFIINIYTLEGEPIRKLDLYESILQITWVDDLLCAITVNNLIVFNLETIHEPKRIQLPPIKDLNPSFRSICFGKKYLILTQSSGIYALPISFLKDELDPNPSWISKKNINYIVHFPRKDDFVQVVVEQANRISLYLLSVVNHVFSESIIVKNIPFSPPVPHWIGDFIFHQNRLIVTYCGNDFRQIFAYDCITKCIDTISSEKSNSLQRITYSPF